MGAGNESVKQIREESPFPWTQVMYRGGDVQLIDAEGKIVPLFSITRMAILATETISCKTPSKEAA